MLQMSDAAETHSTRKMLRALLVRVITEDKVRITWAFKIALFGHVLLERSHFQSSLKKYPMIR